MAFRPLTAFLMVAAVVLATATIGFFGAHAPVEATTEPVASASGEVSLEQVEYVLGVLVSNAAAPNAERVGVRGAIDGMLRTLDPHSRYFPPDQFRELREQQSGTYSGLGITVSSRFGRITVVAPPFPGAPAEKAGMRVGDVISHVDGDPIGGLEMSTVVSLLKGPKGTPVDVRIVRPGVDEPIDIAIIRDEIRNFTLSNAFLIRDDIAYIKIDSFAGTTSDELRQALEILGADAVSGLILDLRGNPGGLMQEAIDVSELFLDKGLDVLETRGRNPGSEHIYESRREDSGYPGALIVVINRQSASASEIVAGAIQDHDRGLVIGDTSFGKGLVQSVFSLGGGSGLALTTQKWYTPSGRLIQRDYSRISEFDYYNPSVVIEPSIDDIHYSDLGRVVYGGGGVTPDVAVAARELNPVEERLGESFVFYTFARGQRPATPAAPDQFEVTGPMLDEFLRHAQERGIDLTPGELAANREFVSNRIRYEVIYNVSGVSEAARILIDDDPQIQRAIELIPEAGRLAARARSEASGQTRD